MVFKSDEVIREVEYTLEVFSEGILYFTLNGSKIGLKQIEGIKKVLVDVVDGEKFRLIIDFGGFVGLFSEEAKNAIARDLAYNKLKVCTAFVTTSLTTSILIGIHYRINRSRTPVHTFSSRKEAIEWAKTIPID